MSDLGRMAHRQLLEQLGAFALGGLSGPERAALQAHLDGCAACRAELGELLPLAADLRLVDPARSVAVDVPPGELGARIAAAVRAESGLRHRRELAQRRRRLALRIAPPIAAAVAGVLVTLAVVDTSPSTPKPAAIPMEKLTVAATAAGVQVSDAILIPHGWGLEVRLVATGLRQGEVYRGVVRTRDGRSLPAGQFLGTGAKAIKCDLQAALLRPDAVGFEVVDDKDANVVRIPLG